jgi:ribosomal protein S18 acetylase RimI-like enzyme
MRAAGLDRAATTLDADEPQFLLELDALRVPEGATWLGPLDPARAADWRAAYERELGFGKADPEEAARQVADWIAAGSHRMLWDGAEPVAMTGFNAALPDIVQVGGVYVPPALRGRGHARRAVGLHLAEARARGGRRATLFAASTEAVACYRPLGFERVGTFALILFDGTARVS